MLIVARRPDSPVLGRRQRPRPAATAAPRAPRAEPQRSVAPEAPPHAGVRERRAVRIVAAPSGSESEEQRRRARLLQRLLASEGTLAITRAARDFVDAGHRFPEEQPVQLQLLEHRDEAVARQAVEALQRLLAVEPPQKRPVLDQRLRRLEETGEDPETRALAAALRRRLRG